MLILVKILLKIKDENLKLIEKMIQHIQDSNKWNDS